MWVASYLNLLAIPFSLPAPVIKPFLTLTLSIFPATLTLVAHFRDDLAFGPDVLDDFPEHFLFDPDDVLVWNSVVLHDALEHSLVFLRAFVESLPGVFVVPPTFAGVFLRKIGVGYLWPHQPSFGSNPDLN